MSPAASSRPKRSRLGLVVILAAMGWAAWHFVLGPKPPSPEELAIRPLPYVMWGLKPDWTRAPSRYRGPSSTNAQGFRGPAIEMPKPEGRLRVVCLGGSTTYSYAVEDDQTYPVRLQAELAAARPDLDVEVINAGVESYTVAESVNNLVFRVLELEPDVIVVYHGANDVRPRRYSNFAPGYEHYRFSWDGTTDHYAPLEGTDVQGMNALLQKHPPEVTSDKTANLNQAGDAAYRRILTSLVGVAQVHGVRPVLVTLAVNEEKARAEQQPELITGIRQHNQVAREVAAATGARLVDIAAALERDGSWFVDSVHLDAQGCEEKARLISNELAGEL